MSPHQVSGREVAGVGPLADDGRDLAGVERHEVDGVVPQLRQQHGSGAGQQLRVFPLDDQPIQGIDSLGLAAGGVDPPQREVPDGAHHNNPVAPRRAVDVRHLTLQPLLGPEADPLAVRREERRQPTLGAGDRMGLILVEVAHVELGALGCSADPDQHLAVRRDCDRRAGVTDACDVERRGGGFGETQCGRRFGLCRGSSSDPGDDREDRCRRGHQPRQDLHGQARAGSSALGAGRRLFEIQILERQGHVAGISQALLWVLLQTSPQQAIEGRGEV